MQLEIEIEGVGEGHQSAQGGVRLLCGEQSPNRLGLDACTSSQLSFRELQLSSPGIEGPDHSIDLVDSLPGAIVCLPVVRTPEAVGQVPLGTSARLHVPIVDVTCMLRTTLMGLRTRRR